MIDNSQDKGYTYVYTKKNENGVYLLDMLDALSDNEASQFYIDYNAGEIFVDWGDGSKDVIGYYESTTNSSDLINVFDPSKTKIIGRVGRECIYFRKKDAVISNEGYIPAEEECLAYYTKNGNITGLRLLPYVGSINGSEIGGAAAFVALFYSFGIKSIFCDFFEMSYVEFREKHNDYLHPLGE